MRWKENWFHVHDSLAWNSHSPVFWRDSLFCARCAEPSRRAFCLRLYGLVIFFIDPPWDWFDCGSPSLDWQNSSQVSKSIPHSYEVTVTSFWVCSLDWSVSSCYFKNVSHNVLTLRLAWNTSDCHKLCQPISRFDFVAPSCRQHPLVR